MFPSIFPRLAKGEAIVSTIAGCAPGEREFLAAQSIQSIALIPVFAFGEMWGFIGFDDCTRDEVFGRESVRALEAAATAIGSEIERRANEAALRAANE